jgi:hypothetical protein
MKKNILFFLAIFFPFWVLASSITEQIKANMGTCFDISKKLSSCERSSCVMPYPEINGAWYTIIIKGMNTNGKCYTVSYAFLNDKIVSEAEHCWYDKQNLELSAQKTSQWANATSSLDAVQAESEWQKLKLTICKSIVVDK